MRTTCCIAGGGPAGMMLGFLLARAGIDVVVLEKHADFLRDFRGDTVHPSTLEVMYELGLLDDFLRLPHIEVRSLAGEINGVTVPIADLSRLPTHCKFIALMPQWDFLNFIAARAKRYPRMRLLMQAPVRDLLVEGSRVCGVRANSPEGELEIRADLVVAADGRHSTVRERAGFLARSFGVPIDVLWMRLSKHSGDRRPTAGYFAGNRLLVALDRGDYWQVALVIPKGAFETLQARGIEALRSDIAAIAPYLRGRVDELQDWDQVKLLTVQIDRLERWWKPGLLCIGDAAHAMSPMGGVGINLAIQDAVAAANILASPLRSGTLSERDLDAVQRRRMFPTRMTQGAQVFVGDRVFRNISLSTTVTRSGNLPWPVKLMRAIPYLRRIPAYVVGVGVRPEHVHTPEILVPEPVAS